MKLPGKNKQCLIGRKYPRSYFKVERLIQEEQQYRNERKKTPFLTKIEFNELLEKLPTQDNDINSEEEEEAGIIAIVTALANSAQFSGIRPWMYI